MNPLHEWNRRRRVPRVSVETLEARELLTGGAGNTFAIVPGAVTTAGVVDTIPFTIDPGHFTFPHGHALLGVDVASATGSSVKPVIVSITGPNGQPLHLAHGHYNPKTQRTIVANGLTTSAVTATFAFNPSAPTQPETYHVTVMGQSSTTGGFVLGFYLPGDVAGSGTVTKADQTATIAALHTVPSSTKYNFEADANRDGLINSVDVRITKQNLGVSTTVSPVISANLNPTSTTGNGSRVTNDSTIGFTGAATPGASITYTDVSTNTAPVTTTADSLGNYSITVPVGVGSNTFQITTHDAFGQSISGDINPVTYIPTGNTTPTPTGTLTPTTSATPTTPATTTPTTPPPTTTPAATPTPPTTTPTATTPTTTTPAATPTTPTTATTPTTSTTSDPSTTSSGGSTSTTTPATGTTVTTTVTTPTAVTTTTTPVTATSTTTTTPSGTTTTTPAATTPTSTTTTTPTTSTTPVVVPPKPDFPFAKNSKIWKAYLTAVAASQAQTAGTNGTTATS